MAFTLPNEVDAAFGDQAELHSRDIDILVAGHGLTGVLSGGAVTAQVTPDGTAAVAAGAGLTTGDYVTWTAGNVTATAADATNPRFDLVYVTSGGVKTYLAGTAGTNPTPPALPAGGIALAVRYTAANDNTVNANELIDKRVILLERGYPGYVLAAADAPASTKAIANAVASSTDARADFTTAVSGGGKKVRLTAGTYPFSGEWLDSLTSNLVIEGAGMGVTVIQLANGSNSRLIRNQSGHPLSNVTFRDLTFDGNKTNQTDGAARDDRAGLLLFNIDGLTLERVETRNFRHGASIRVYNCNRMREQGNYYHDNGQKAATSGSHTLPQATITVDDTTGFASAGKLSVGGAQVVTYTGKTGTTFTGGTGGTGTFAAGTSVYPVTNDVNQVLLICDAVFHGSSQDLRVNNIIAVNNTDTGTAMDGQVRASVANNLYVTNALAVGVGFSNAEGTGAADSGEDIDIGNNIMIGLNQANHESQGVKIGSFGNTGDGANNRRVRIHDNTIRLADRPLWLDTLDDSEVDCNILADPQGPNKQILLLAPTGTSVNRLGIANNKFKNTTNRGISFDTGTITGIELMNNTFDTDVATPVGGTVPADTVSSDNNGYGSKPNVTAMTFVIDGGGAAITTGVKGDVRVPFTCAVTGWDLVADASGSIVIDVWRDTYANFPPTVADTIAGTEKPTLSSVAKNQDTSLTTWTTALTEGDWLRINVDSAATVQRVSVALYLKRT